MTLYLPAPCVVCSHFRGVTVVADALQNTGACNAFPSANGIPLGIWLGGALHSRPYPGDGGITFAARDEAGREYADLLFSRNRARGDVTVSRGGSV